MLVGRATSPIGRIFVTRYRSPLIIHDGPANHLCMLINGNHFHSLPQFHHKLTTSQICLSHYNPYLNKTLAYQRFGFSSSALPQSEEKGTETDDKYQGEQDLTVEDMIKLVTEKEELLKTKQEEIEKLKHEVAELKIEAENSKNFAIQDFAKSILIVADTLESMFEAEKSNFVKFDIPEDSSTGALPLVAKLLYGVEMTGKQLAEVLKKFGVEKYVTTVNEEFDPNRHHAGFDDATKPHRTISLVYMDGYTMHGRTLRPAEVFLNLDT